jgi:uncharacterized SAM-binding protein YcdF (DUF218 family)
MPKRIIRPFRRLIKLIVLISGIIAIVMLVLSFTSLPYWGYYYLGKDRDSTPFQPDVIVLLGNNGMPDADGLLKCYYTAEASKESPNAKIIIALPVDSLEMEPSDLEIINNELSLHGVDTCWLAYEKKGINTYEQGLYISQFLGKQVPNVNLLIITNPEHLYRSMATFRKFGYKRVGGRATYSKPLAASVLIGKNESQRKIEPASLAFRYNMWNYLKLEITVLREYTAIAYYKLRGWI